MVRNPSDFEVESEMTGAALVTAGHVARMLRVSKRTVWRMLSAGRLPVPIRVGGIVRWRIDEIKKWIYAGCPERS
jgi:excisionase family DNA binding protein